MRVEETIEIDAPREAVWEYVADPANYPQFMSGMSIWTPEEGSEPTLGGRFRMRMRVGAAEVGGRVEIVEFDPPGEMAWTSLLGIEQRGRWRLRDTGAGRTRVMLRLSYQAPGRLFGALADRLSAPQVRASLRSSLTALKHRIETGVPRAATSEDGRLAQVTGMVSGAVEGARVIGRSGLIRPERPDRLARSALAMARFGLTPAAGFAAAAARFPDGTALVDDAGSLTFEQLHRRTNSLAHSLSDAGVLEGDGVAIMCRNHRGFVEAVAALSKLGAHALLLNTSFAGPQLSEVVKREKPKALVYDEEFADLLSHAGRRRKRFVAWTDGSGAAGDDETLEELVATGDPSEVVAPSEPGKIIILTSGTTGTPKGASRPDPGTSLEPVVALLSRIPLRARERTMIAAPLFHSWGFAHLMFGLAMSSTYVLRPRFDPEDTLAMVARHRCRTLVAVPVMIQRIMGLPREVRAQYDLSSLEVVALSGSALPGELALRFMDEYGDVIYSLYGSTEVAWAAIAGPEDLRRAPDTAGRPPRGTTLKILDEDGVELPTGESGRIFVGNSMLFEGYTGGGGKDMVGDLMSTGDVGRVDHEGRLFVEGRDDEMIVSGGENVFPREVEDVLAKHDSIVEAAAIGVEDEDFGQRLRAFVVVKGGGLSEKDVKSYVGERLARYKVPREVVFLDELPRNSTGKILKRVLEGDGEGEGD